MKQEELDKILEEHKLWLETRNTDNVQGKCADLRYADLREANLRYTYLRGADLRGTYLIEANLRYAKLNESDLSGAYIRDADLIYTDLRYANLSCADLSGAKIENVIYNEYTSFFTLQCPEKGSFIGYKCSKCLIVELQICEDALRSSATSRKCRCSKAKVLSITSVDGTENYERVVSDFDSNFVYEVGKIVEVKDFDTDRWNECESGIHFFLTRQEAVNYI